MILLSLLSMRSLAQDLPENLKPEFKYCVDRDGAEKIQTCFDENAVCHSLVKQSIGPDTFEIVLIGVGAFFAGAVIGHQFH